MRILLYFIYSIDVNRQKFAWLFKFFSPNDYDKNDRIILKYFEILKRRKNYIVLFAVSIENLQNLKYQAS